MDLIEWYVSERCPKWLRHKRWFAEVIGFLDQWNFYHIRYVIGVTILKLWDQVCRVGREEQGWTNTILDWAQEAMTWINDHI